MKVNKKLLFANLVLFAAIFPATVLGEDTNAPTLICNFLGAIHTIAITLIVVGWIIAGIIYLSSAGSAERMTIGKKAITAAIMGTVLVIVATLAEEVVSGLLGLSTAFGGTTCSYLIQNGLFFLV